MSLHYEVVFACFLRDGTPETVLAALQWHTGATADRPPHLDANEHPYPLLVLSPDSWLPGGDFASLQRQSRGNRDAWGLFTRNFWLDDDIGELVTILDLLAPHVEDPGYGGYIREEDDGKPSFFTFHDGAYDLQTE
ncbi:hypothetical protein ACFV7R_38470 [Streptomyces sp. NPDC059866]|uniref:hypothetical protein n=1 Tax=Streptomyces sp. NPDC059866 TaxID=3346978 RepID=UPI00366A1DBA